MSPRVSEALACQLSWQVFLQVNMAEDARFELARACTQHAFQVCAPAFTAGRARP
jgi:hypothetical protein